MLHPAISPVQKVSRTRRVEVQKLMDLLTSKWTLLMIVASCDFTRPKSIEDQACRCQGTNRFLQHLLCSPAWFLCCWGQTTATMQLHSGKFRPLQKWSFETRKYLLVVAPGNHQQPARTNPGYRPVVIQDTVRRGFRPASSPTVDRLLRVWSV